MAYIIGDLREEEEAELTRRGWEVETMTDPGQLRNDGLRLRMVWVDNDMLSIMSGPDWDRGEP